jgi:magnesium transporter
MRASGAFRPSETASTANPWERLQELLESGEPEAILSFLFSLPPGEPGRAISRLSEDDRSRLLTLLLPEDAAELLGSLPDAQATEMLEELPAEQAASIVEELPSAEQADVLGDLDAPEAEAILEHMTAPRATSARRLLSYDPQTAGGIMSTEYLSFRVDQTVGDVLTDLRENSDRYSDYDIQYVYVVDADERLIGVLRLRDLVLARGTEPVRQIMLKDPLRASDDTSLDDLKRIFDEHSFIGIPIVALDDRLVGVIRRAAVEEALRVRATRTFLQVSGLIGEDELRSMPLRQRSFRRLSWLSINIVLNMIAASIIAIYQDTLSAVIALAVFLPIISDMSGCSGNQAVAVSIRELTLGLIRPYEFVRVVMKEGAVGIINGIVLGALLGTLAALWKGNLYLGLVVGTALALNTVVAVLLGGSIPLALRSLKLDPALASGPILTTVTDMCGFFLVLSFASAMLAQLV